MVKKKYLKKISFYSCFESRQSLSISDFGVFFFFFCVCVCVFERTKYQPRRHLRSY